jgi:hypothetical protein
MRGLAATAVGDWQSARAAWMRIGVPIDDGEGPPIVDMGEALVRLWRSRKVEAIVRGARIDPCRTRLEEVPVPETGNLWHDVVLHALVDWAAWRPLGHPIIFDELERLEPGPYSTVEVDVTVPAATDLADAVARLTRAGLSAEDFSSYRYGCDWCDEYSPHAHDGPGGERIWLTVHRIGVAGAHGAVAAVLREWASAAPGREFTGLHQPGV